MMNSGKKLAGQDRAGKKLAGKKLAVLVIVLILVIAAAFYYFRSEYPEKFDQNLSEGHTIDNFLVRDGQFDCTTLFDEVPIGLLWQIPGMVNKRHGDEASRGTQSPDGNTVCSMGFVATGDSAGLDSGNTSDSISIPAEPGTPQFDNLLALHNTLNILGLPTDYRSFVVITRPACNPLNTTNPTPATETFTDPAGMQWHLEQSAPDDAGAVGEVARLSDDQLGCVLLAVIFPGGNVSPEQSTTTRAFLRRTITAMSGPLSASMSATKAGDESSNSTTSASETSKNQTTNNKAITAQATFRNNDTIDCRAYIFNTSLTQQREIGLVSDFERIPGDFVSSPTDARETPLYKIAPDGSSVTCWFTTPTGFGMGASANHSKNAPVTAIATGARSDFALPQSAPVSEVLPDAAELNQWHYFLHLPGNSPPLSQSEQEQDSQPASPLEFENSRTPTLNLYRCGTDDGTGEEGSRRPGKGKDKDSAEDHNCLILSTPVEGSLDQDMLKVLAQVAKRINPLF